MIENDINFKFQVYLDGFGVYAHCGTPSLLRRIDYKSAYGRHLLIIKKVMLTEKIIFVLGSRINLLDITDSRRNFGLFVTANFMVNNNLQVLQKRKEQ